MRSGNVERDKARGQHGRTEVTELLHAKRCDWIDLQGTPSRQVRCKQSRYGDHDTRRHERERVARRDPKQIDANRRCSGKRGQHSGYEPERQARDRVLDHGPDDVPWRRAGATRIAISFNRSATR